MTAVSEAITERLRKLIGEKGLITYEEFIDIVLYDEQTGYYRKGKQRGRDYYTSPEVHPVFGRTIGKYLERLAGLLDAPRFSVLELGGGQGDLAHAIISSIGKNRLTRYLILEKGEREKEERIDWVRTLDSLPACDELTFVLANEFFDALPFHRVMMSSGILHEIYIGFSDGFFETPGPLTTDVSSFLGAYPIDLDEGQVGEVTTRSNAIIEGLTRVLQRSFFLALDYGYHTDELAAGRFTGGSVVGYKSKFMRDDIFASPGEMDITHHVNFDHFCALFAKYGWKRAGEIEQYRFLYNAGILEEVARLDEEERVRAKMLITPEGLGSAITALAFTKEIDLQIPGFKRSGR
jgi:SAM-dependent MidA family methyltransferase